MPNHADRGTPAPAHRPPKIWRPSVEVNVTEHCNLSCYGCNHASPVLTEEFLSVDAFIADFEALTEVFHSDELRFVGGEPLLHPQLPRILSEAKRIGVADRMVLYTNGVLLHRMERGVWELLDEIRVSAYPGVTRRLSEEDCAASAKRYGVRLEITHIGHFRQTLLNQRIENDQLVASIYRDCKEKGEWSCHILRHGKFYKCPIAAVTGERLRMLGVEFHEHPGDAVHVTGNPNLREDLRSYLADERPLAACAYCLGTSGPSVPHRQMNRAAKIYWLQESHSPDIEATRVNLHDPVARVVSWLRSHGLRRGRSGAKARSADTKRSGQARH
jgi:organic radical activating enzyme